MFVWRRDNFESDVVLTGKEYTFTNASREKEVFFSLGEIESFGDLIDGGG